MILFSYLKKKIRVLHTLLLYYKYIVGWNVVVKDSIIKGKLIKLHNKSLIVKSEILSECIINEDTSIVSSFLKGHISIGKNCGIGNSQINNYTYVNDGSSINNTIIGKYCSIGPNLKVGYGKHPINYMSTSPVLYKKVGFFTFFINNNDSFSEYERTIIQNDVWIGANVFINEGVTIGNGSIIGAGAIVTKDIPPYSIVGGVPAKIIKYRFNGEIVDYLQQLRWWDKDIDWIKRNRSVFNVNISLLTDINLIE